MGIIKENSFLDLFNDSNAAIKAKFAPSSDEKALTIQVSNKLGLPVSQKGKEYLGKLCNHSQVADFVEFYNSYDGIDLCVPYSPANCRQIPLVKFIPSLEIHKFQSQYLPGGHWDWVIDLNKSQAIYRGGHSWISFAKIGEGPSCLTMFLDGENAGCIFYVTPQPHFNILKPIAKSFTLLLSRIAKDPAAFFRLVRAYIIVSKADGQNYGFAAVDYLRNSGD